MRDVELLSTTSQLRTTGKGDGARWVDGWQAQQYECFHGWSESCGGTVGGSTGLDWRGPAREKRGQLPGLMATSSGKLISTEHSTAVLRRD